MVKHILCALALTVGLASAQPVNVGTRIADSLAAAGYEGDSNWTMNDLVVENLTAANLNVADTTPGLRDTVLEMLDEGLDATFGTVDADSIYWAKGLSNPVNYQYLLNSSSNSIDPRVLIATNLTAGSNTMPCKIGASNTVPVGDDFEMGWVADTGDFQSSMTVVDAIGGYDCVVNSTGSVILGGHHAMVGYGPVGHGTIVGGSYSYLSGNASRSSILAAHYARIFSGFFNNITGGTTSLIDTGAGGLNSISNSHTSSILSGSYSTLDGAQLSSLRDTSTRSSVRNSQYVDITAQNVHALGVHGAPVVFSYKNQYAYGKDVPNLASGMVLGIDSVGTHRLSSVYRVLARAVTESSLQQNLRYTGIRDAFVEGSFILPVGSAFSGRVRLTGLNTTDGTQMTYLTDVGGMIDSRGVFMFKDGTETPITDTVSAIIDLDPISQSNNSFVPACSPRVRITTGGGIRITACGVASKRIVWLGSMDFDVISSED